MVKVLRKGTFHLHNDKNGGHPALIVEKNDKKNIYKAVKFTHKDDKVLISKIKRKK